MNCSRKGYEYELEIYNIVKKCTLFNGNSKNVVNFNTQNVSELGKSSSSIDIQCNYNSIKDVGIEVKKAKTPDWMQCKLNFVQHNFNESGSSGSSRASGIWEVTNKNKISDESRNLFETLLKNIKPFNNEAPPFISQKLKYDEWKKIKSQTTKWNDQYFDIPDDTIQKLYNFKSCSYIQLSNGYGLFHLGEDKCNFNVPLFKIKQQLRIRTKIHTTKDSKGYCKLSVMASCKPKNVKELIPSPYSLDDINRLPLPLFTLLK